MDDFYQSGPVLGNQYHDDHVLRDALARVLKHDVRHEVEPRLAHLGARAANELLELAREAEAHPPRHVPYDPWGRRIDDILISPAWERLKRVAAEEGIVATAYERFHGRQSRLVQFALLYLYHPSSAVFSCPLAMTDGAARALELYGDDLLRMQAFTHLTTRDPDEFWTSGQWMTERTGGSDVSGTATIAREENGRFRLHGTKWFTSATTSEMAMTLARTRGAPEGSRGLSLFYLELRKADGRLNHIEIHRLKDKLGTRALPTAELTLKGTHALMIGKPGDGVKKISALFNITRIYNSICAVSFMRRGLALARSYSGRRIAFGKPLAEHPLHVRTLADQEVRFRGCFQLTLLLSDLQGREECGEITPDEQAVLRLMTPVAKLFTAKHGVALASEVLESFGGAGYVEDTGLPALLRDAQVLSIWEGTTNVLSLDALRAIAKEKAFAPFVAFLTRRIELVQHPRLSEGRTRLKKELKLLLRFAEAMNERERPLVELGARNFAMHLGALTAGVLLAEQAEWQQERPRGESARLALLEWLDLYIPTLRLHEDEDLDGLAKLALS